MCVAITTFVIAVTVAAGVNIVAAVGAAFDIVAAVASLLFAVCCCGSLVLRQLAIIFTTSTEAVYRSLTVITASA